jgi:hypothetical protein
MADAERHVHSRGSLALGGRFAGKTVRLLRSRPVTDRGSVFVAHLAFPVSTEAEANAAVSALKRACAGDVVDHAMSAWRVPKRGTGKGSPEKKKTAVKKKTPVETSFDDDGEPRGGASIRAELNKLDAVGVACVVTRAYGGVNLGKKRFEHIRERVAKLCAAAGIEPGTLVSSDAFRNAGRANVLGTETIGRENVSNARLAAALGGARTGGDPENKTSAENLEGDVSAAATDFSNGVSASAVEALFSKNKKRKKTAPKKKALPASVADDIRARLAEAAERRRVENERKCFPGNAADGVIDLCGDDERFAKRARNERGA